MHPVGLTIIGGNPEAIKLGNAVRRAWIEWRGFALRDLADRAVEFRGRGLIESRPFFQTQNANGLKKAQRPERVSIGGIFRRFKTDLDVALRGEIVNFGRLGFLNDTT